MQIGQYRSSLDQEGRALVEQLGGRWTGAGGMCRCPAHDDRTPSLSVRPGRSRLLFHCFAGCATREIIKALDANRLIAPAAPATRPDSRRAPGDAALRAAAKRLWESARDIAGTPAADYLEARGLETGSGALRFHRRTPHGPRPLTRFRPALIAAVRDETGLVAVHRTFLRRAGGAIDPRPAGRAALGRLGGGAVRLVGGGPRLGLAEGIETALAATALSGLPCWATLGTERFALVALPPETRELVLFLDNDTGGRRAEALARAAFGKACAIEARYPCGAGQDWNDSLVAARRRREEG